MKLCVYTVKNEEWSASKEQVWLLLEFPEGSLGESQCSSHHAQALLFISWAQRNCENKYLSLPALDLLTNVSNVPCSFRISYSRLLHIMSSSGLNIEYFQIEKENKIADSVSSV